MLDERHVFVLRFRELAAQFINKEYAENGVVDENGKPVATELPKQAVLNEAGKLIIAAYNRGFLALPGLGALVDWVQNPPPHPEGAQASLCPCPSNLYREVCGFNWWPVNLLADGKAEVSGDAFGGIVPKMLADSPALHRPTLAQSINRQNATLRMQFGLVCKLLADEIERTSGPDARDCWIYEQWQIGRTWEWILTNLPEWCPDREQITNTEGIRQAAKRYAAKHGLPLRKGKRGRPPRNTN